MSWPSVDGHGQIVDVYVSSNRATEDATAFFRCAIKATGVIPDTVTTDCAATYPPALAAVLPEAEHETGKRVQQRVERDHQHLKGRIRGMRGFKTLAGARVLCRAHALLRNPRGGFYDLASTRAAAEPRHSAGVAGTWDALTATLLT